jgi:trk system potassium uptake protein TrkH
LYSKGVYGNAGETVRGSMKILHYRERIANILHYMATILMVGGFTLLIPFVVGLVYDSYSIVGGLISAFLVPGFIMIVLGLVGRHFFPVRTISLKDSMLICALSWVLFSLLGAVPYIHVLGIPFLNAWFETMSGFTTTGITLLNGLDAMPRSILFWRALTQWIGGLGILSMFSLLGFKGAAAANKLFLAESHEIASKRPSPGIFQTVRAFWALYVFFTLAEAVILLLLRVKLFDALTHAFTTVSTGGFSIYDNSIAHYRISGHPFHHLIELTYLVFMLVGSINFFIHFRFWRGNPRSLWDNAEMRYFWVILLGGIMLIALSTARTYGLFYYDTNGTFHTGAKSLFLHIKDIAFQATAIMTTTGYATRDIGSFRFTAFTQQVFLLFMVIGGCAGSTGGGIKVIRVAILAKLLKNRVAKLNSHRLARTPLAVDGKIVSDEEIKRIATILFSWIALLVIGGGITAFFSSLSGWASFSGMFSALGNIGPCYISNSEMVALHPVIKLTYIFGMLAGRLEIFPIVIIFNRKFFR